MGADWIKFNEIILFSIYLYECKKKPVLWSDEIVFYFIV